MKKLLVVITSLTVFLYSCRKEEIAPVIQQEQTESSSTARIYTGFPEAFESGTKTAYAVADVAISTGSWNFNDALLGTSTSDRKNGLKCVRIQNTGIISMNFDVTGGASVVTLAYGVFGTDASSTFELWASTNSGSTWTKVGNTYTASSTTLATASITMNLTGNVRFQVRKLSGGRLNIDDFSIDDNSNTPVRDDNMAMGNPSAATTDVNFPNNYLMVKSQYVLSYNNSKGTANWVSWHLSSAWKGSALRCDCFNIDNTLPASFSHVSTSNYTNSGFDRGHMCPSDDRDGSDTDNAATFLMTNMIPQAPNLNQVTWANLENYVRTLLASGNEVYTISGGYGSGGTGSLGGTTTSIASGKINVPSHCWKVIVILTNGSNDVSRVTTSTRVIAVDMPNTQTVNAQPWGYYRTSVDAIETATGYNFLSNVSTTIQNAIEASVDNGPTQ